MCKNGGDSGYRTGKPFSHTAAADLPWWDCIYYASILPATTSSYLQHTSHPWSQPEEQNPLKWQSQIKDVGKPWQRWVLCVHLCVFHALVHTYALNACPLLKQYESATARQSSAMFLPLRLLFVCLHYPSLLLGLQQELMQSGFVLQMVMPLPSISVMCSCTLTH